MKTAKRIHSDKSDSQLVTFIMLLPLLMMLLITMIDMSLYFSNRAQMSNFARDGARTVAIFGGNGTSGTQTAIEKKYGISRSSVCVASNTLGTTVTTNALTSSSTAIECQMMKAISSSMGLTAVTIESIKCSPAAVSSIGQPTSCAIGWRYNGIPGAGLNFIKLTDSSGKPGLETTTGSSEAEVTNPTMVSR